jgi:beta-lactamase class A
VTEVGSRIRDVLRSAGVRGWVHARALVAGDGAEQVAVDPDVQLPMASLYKILLAVAWAREVDAGRMPADHRVTVPAGDRTPGPTGLSALHDPVELSVRDLVVLSLTMSDNAASDVLLDLVGLDAVRRVAADAAMTRTTVHGGSRHHQRLLLEETGVAGFPEAVRLLRERPGHDPVAVYDPAMSSVTTARDLTSLLAALWVDRLASPGLSRFVRDTMARQAFRHRMGSGFPHDDVTVASKTGTLLSLRHEAGVVTFPGEEPVAVAVLTHAARPAQLLPAADLALGEAAALAVHALRRPRGR